MGSLQGLDVENKIKKPRIDESMHGFFVFKNINQ
jgi:hypothetical protein